MSSLSPPAIGVLPYPIDCSRCDVRAKPNKVKLGKEDYYVSFDKIGRATEISSTPPKPLNFYDSNLTFRKGVVKLGSKRDVLKYFNSHEVTKEYVRTEEAKILSEITDIDRYDSLCLSGGGARGFGFTGVFKQLGNDRLANNIKDVSGSSIGSLAALIVACGLTADEISDFVADSEVQFSEASIYKIARLAIRFKLLPHAKEIASFLKAEEFPLLDASGNAIKRFDCPNVLDCLTFKQLDLIRSSSSETVLPDVCKLKLKEIVIIATNDVTKKEVELSAANSPQLPLVDAVRASCGYPIKVGSKSIPTSLIINHSGNGKIKASAQKHVSLSDGGATNNTPHLYLKGKHKLVVAFTTAEQRVSRDKLTFTERFVQGVIGVPLYKHEQYDIRAACDDSSVSMFFLNSPISSKNLKGATKDFFLIELDAMKQFAEFECSRKVVLRSYHDLPRSEVNLIESSEDWLSASSGFFWEGFDLLHTAHYIYSKPLTPEEILVDRESSEPINSTGGISPELNKFNDSFNELTSTPAALDLSRDYCASSSKSSLLSGASGVYNLVQESKSTSQSIGSISLDTHSQPDGESNWLLLDPRMPGTNMVKSSTVPAELTLDRAKYIEANKTMKYLATSTLPKAAKDKNYKLRDKSANGSIGVC